MNLKSVLSTTLLTSATLIGISVANVNAKADDNNSGSQDNQSTQIINNAPDKQQDYNKSFKATKKLANKSAYFYKKPGSNKKSGSAKKYYNKDLKISRIASNNGDVYYKTNYGWLNAQNFNQKVKYRVDLDYKMKVNADDVAVYNKPATVAGAQKIGNTTDLDLTGHYYRVDQRVDTNLKDGYYRFEADGKNYWISAKNMSFDLNSLKGSNRKIETAISTGEALIGKSPYSWGGGRTAASIASRRFDCSSFVHYVFAKAGVSLGAAGSASTFTERNYGTAVSPSNMKRGDIFFFNAKGEGAFCHVGIYLGKGLFLHDSPSSDTGGVGVSTLKDPYWAQKFNKTVRRLVH